MPSSSPNTTDSAKPISVVRSVCEAWNQIAPQYSIVVAMIRDGVGRMNSATWKARQSPSQSRRMTRSEPVFQSAVPNRLLAGLRHGGQCDWPAPKHPSHRWSEDMGGVVRSPRLRLPSRAQHRAGIIARLQVPGKFRAGQ